MSRKTTGTPGSSRRRVAVGTALLSLTALIGAQMAGASSDTATITSFNVYDGTETGGAAVGPVKGGNQVLVVKGTNLDEVEHVYFGTIEADDVLLENDTLLYVTPPAATEADTVDVVFTEDGQDLASGVLKKSYEYTDGPILSSVTVANKELTITGQQLLGATAVLVGDTLVKVNKKTPATDTQVKVKAPSTKNGLLDVSVITPSGIGTLAGAYGAVPVVKKVINPDAADPKKAVVKTASAATGTVSTLNSATSTVASYASDTGTVVLLQGTGFSGLKKVRFGSSVASAVVINDSTLRVRIPAKAETDAFDAKSPNIAKINIVVENQFGESKPVKFQYHRAPVITTVSDIVGAANAATNTITITGDGLEKAKVLFNKKAGKVTSSTNTTIVVTVPKQASAGEVALGVASPAGHYIIDAKYTYATTDTTTAWPSN